MPPSYTGTLKQAQAALGRMDGHGCADPPSTMLSYVFPGLLSVPFGDVPSIPTREQSQRLLHARVARCQWMKAPAD